MCNPISLILTEDKVFLPPNNLWNYSHSFIMEKNNIPYGLIGHKYLRLEVVPPDENILREKKTNEKLEVDDSWGVKVNEKNIPNWYINDLANHENRARISANEWLQNCPCNLIPGYKEIAGDNAILNARNCSTLVARDNAILTAGHNSTLIARDDSVLTTGYNSILTARMFSTLTSEGCSTLNSWNNSRLTAGHCSRLTAGYNSELIAGEESLLTAYNNSIFCAGKNSTFNLLCDSDKILRTTTVYVGEDGIEPNTKYLGKDGKFIELKDNIVICNPISLILSEDKVFLPPDNIWSHSYSFIMETHNIPGGLTGDKYLRLEVVPPDENIFRDKDTNERLEVDDSWKIKVDENNIPDWYKNDLANHENRVIKAAKKYFNNFPDNLIPGSSKNSKNYAKITFLNDSILTAGNYSILTAGDNATLTAGYNSELIAGECSLLTAYNGSIFCAGIKSSFIFYWYNGKEYITITLNVGEDGIKPNKRYRGIDGKFEEVPVTESNESQLVQN